MADTEWQMSGLGILSELKESIASFWVDRNARERIILAAGATLILLGLIYAVLFGPALSGRAQLQKNLPLLRQQAADMQAMARDATKLAGVTTAPPAIVTKESVEALLAKKGFKSPTVAVSGDVVRLQLSSVSFVALLDALDELRKTAGLAVLDASIVAQAPIDTVNASLTLRQQKNVE
jgi:general secretion pathway protein M